MNSKLLLFCFVFLTAALVSTVSRAALLPGEEPGNPLKKNSKYRVTFADDPSNPPAENSSRRHNWAFQVHGPEDRYYWFRYSNDGYYDLADRVEQALNAKRFSIEDVDRLMKELKSEESEHRPLQILLETSKTYNKLIGRRLQRDYKVEFESDDYTQFMSKIYDGPGPLMHYNLSIKSGEKLYMFHAIEIDFPAPELKLLSEKLQSALDDDLLDASDFAWHTQEDFELIRNFNPTVESMTWVKENYHNRFLKNKMIRAVLDGTLPCAPLVIN